MDDIHNQLLEAIGRYEMPQAAVDLLSTNPPMALAGPTGSGKDAIEEYIQSISDYRHVVTHTTRQLRPGEQNGVNYWYVTDQELLELLNSDAMVEVKLFPKGSQTAYGISIPAYQTTLSNGHKPILIIDVRGVEEISKKLPDLRPMFILPPDFDTWMQRLDARGHMSHVERTKRMQSAKEELEVAVRNPRFILVVNDEIPRVSQEILGGATDAPSQDRNRELAQQLIDHIKAY